MYEGEKHRFSFDGGWPLSNKFLIEKTSMLSSRKAMTNAGFPDMDGQFTVDVGQGKSATLVEEFIARLEPHGVRRLLLSESGEDGEYERYMENRHANQSSVFHTSALSVNAEGQEDESEEHQRSPYFYYCISCDCRLTPICSSSASMEMLQDIHYHCGLASHRKGLSWMVQPDQVPRLSRDGDNTVDSYSLLDDEDMLANDMDLYIKETIRNKPDWQHPEQYLRIYVNEMPVLLSRRPGGGDMFFPLPHEVEEQRWYEKETSPRDSGGRESPPRWTTRDHHDGEERREEVEHDHIVEPQHPIQDDDGRKEEAGPLRPLYSSSSSQKSFWYYPMQSLSCHAHQHLFYMYNPKAAKGFLQRLSPHDEELRQEWICVLDVPWEEYMQFSVVEKLISSTKNDSPRKFIDETVSEEGLLLNPKNDGNAPSPLPSRVIACLGRRKQKSWKRARSEGECILEENSMRDANRAPADTLKGKSERDTPVPIGSMDSTSSSHFLLCKDVSEYPDLKKKVHARRNHDISRYPVQEGDCFDLVYMSRLEYQKFAQNDTEQCAAVFTRGGTYASQGSPVLTVSLLRQHFPLAKKEAKKKRTESSGSFSSVASNSDGIYDKNSALSRSSNSELSSPPNVSHLSSSPSARSLSSSSTSSSSFLSSVKLLAERRR